MNFIEELKWRGLYQDSVPGTEEFLLENKTAGYLGVDPSGNSMHIGNLLPMMMLVHFQRAGHTPIALVGGATGMVGDPSGKDKERQLLSEEQINYNVECMRKQMAHFLDFEAEGNPAIMVNNYDWFKEIGFLTFLRDVGKHITINYMMAKDSVKKRLAGESGISYTEFAYQLLQGYDYVHLYRHHGARLQVGGSDQWGNITTGTELIRRMGGGEDKAYAVICPLLTREDGSKFGKTADGESVWLDPERTTPFQFYQYWINSGDGDAKKYIKCYTLKPREEIEALIEAHDQDPGQRSLQKALAADLVLRVHGQEALDNTLALTAFLFARNTSPEALKALTEGQWKEVAANSPDRKQISQDKLANGINIMDLLVELGITKSKGEARRAILQDKSIRINAERCETIEQDVNMEHVFHGTYFQVQKGKKNRYIVEVES